MSLLETQTGPGQCFHSQNNQGKKKTHKRKQICGIIQGLGGWQNYVYVCVFFFFFVPYGGEKKHVNKIRPKIPGQSHESFVHVPVT